ncbi:hypothetical protein KMP11_06670 [Gemella sp. zg-570]|uniref:hypothetical protein n=1 Tax=Gemella sp. zg-570 TaxID=2840371 RepID=UPI001C0BFF14|nr:hypothetical protein [Gemella sp. zg-570]QWQ38624.1 hypothetical protein KMP11_06670 [Gemella sp. zg-570]
MKTYKKFLAVMMLVSLATTNIIHNVTPVYAIESDEGRVATEDETYYTASFHSQSSDNHFEQLGFEFDFKMIVGYTFEHKSDHSVVNKSITLDKNDFIRRGDGYYRTKKPYSKYLLSKEDYNLIGTAVNVLLLDTDSNKDRYLGYAFLSGEIARWNGNDLKSQIVRNVVRILNRHIEKVTIDYDGELKTEDKYKVIDNIKKANPNMNGNASYTINGEYIEISNIGREVPLKIAIEENVKRVKHTEVMTDLTMDDISSLEESVKKLQARMTTLEQDLSTKDNLNEALQERVEKLEKEKTILQEELANIQTLLDEKIGNIADLKADIVELEKRITELEKEVVSLQEDKKNLTEENTTLQNEKLELAKQIAEKDKIIKEKEDRIIELTNEITSLNNQKEMLANEKENLEKEKETLQNSNDILTNQLLEKNSLIKEKEDEINKLASKILILEKEKEILMVEKTTLEEEKANLQQENNILNHKLVEKEDIIKEKEAKINDLEKQIKQLNEDARCCVNHEELVRITNLIQGLENEVIKLKDDIKRTNVDMPKDIKIGQWYPETIIKFPTKRQYKHNDDIDLSGMVIRFTKYIKENNEYKMVHEDIAYATFKNETHGWEFNLKTPKAIYNKDTNGKMQIKFSFVLKNQDKSME